MLPRVLDVKRHGIERKPRAGVKRLTSQDLKALRDTPPWEWPTNAAQSFLDILIDTTAREGDRLIAAQLAGDFTVINDELSEALMGIVSSAGQPEELRAAAAISLGPVLDHADTSDFDDPYDDVPIAEHTFHRIQLTLHRLYLDGSIPVMVRRRILEAAVRSPQEWHREAIRQAYSSGERDWMLTAVFSMRWVGGFDDLILEALKSSDPDIQCEAVQAAGNRELDAALNHIVTLVHDPATSKPLRLAAIGAVAGIRPREAHEILIELTDSPDEEIAEAAEEAIDLAITDEGSEEFDDEDDVSDWIN